MADEDQDQKTEAPTSKRLDEAREKGQLPVSREISSWSIFLCILIVVGWLGPPMMSKLMTMLRVFLEVPPIEGMTDSGLQAILFGTVMNAAQITGIIFSLLAAAAILGVMIQTGFFASLELIRPDPSRILPSRGLKRIFSLGALVELGKSIGKLVFLGTIAFYIIWPVTSQLAGLTSQPASQGILVLYHQMVRLVMILLLAYTIIALADLFYQRFNFIRNLRMTKNEIKDEYKQQEGDPMIKGRLRQMRVEKARKRMMAQVPKADVIITNPTHYAVAMKYDNVKMAAPVVIAKGINLIADRIKGIASEHEIPLVSNPPLARALHDTVEIDQQIPAEHYRAVAEVISYVYKLKKRKF